MMKRLIAVTSVAVVLGAGSFVGGTWWAQRSGATRAGAPAPAVHYICPMHPDYRSDHPGTCPVCGMSLEVDRAGAPQGRDATAGALPQDAVKVTAERQRAIGVQIGVVGRLAGTRRLRTTGRVVADENRTYPIVAA